MSRVKKNPTGLLGPLTRWATSHRFVGTSPQHKEFMWESKRRVYRGAAARGGW